MSSLPFLVILCLFGIVRPQIPSGARDLDSLIQNYAYSALNQPTTRTGVIYDATLPANLTGVKVSAMRLRAGSLRFRGVSSYKEFHIPVGVIEKPYVERLVLVYSNLGNWSHNYYPLPSGYVYLTPLLGFLAYDASNLSAKNLPELDIWPSAQPISINFNFNLSLLQGSVPRCVYFDLNGSVNLSNALTPGNVCSTTQQGHFAIVVEERITPSPAPAPAPAPAAAPIEALPLPTSGGFKEKRSSINSKILIIGGCVLGGLIILIALGVIVMWVDKYNKTRKMKQMEKAADVGEPLHMTSVGTTKAPAAAHTRTLPTLESEFVP